MAKHGELQFSLKSSFPAKNAMDSQKLPFITLSVKSGKPIRLPAMQTQALALACLFENLSLSIPPSRADTSPPKTLVAPFTNPNFYAKFGKARRK